MPNYSAITHDTYYHIYNRGNNRENIFREERNYHFFLSRYAKIVTPVADTFAYCQMRNHFHILLRIKSLPEIPPKLQDKKPGHVLGAFFNSYAKAFNNAYGRTGSLFENPFRRVAVKSHTHLLHLVIYIHHNPQKHAFVADYRDWPFSSYPALIGTQKTHLERATVHEWFTSLSGFKKAHQIPLTEHHIAPLFMDDFE